MNNNSYERIPLSKRIEAALRMRNRFKVKETVAEISNSMGISRSHLYSLEDKFIEDPSMVDKPRDGRPLKVSDRTERRIVREIHKDPFETSYEVMNSINQGMEEDNQICSGTIRGVALKNDLQACRPLAKPFLTEDHIKLRLAFAEKYKDKTSHFWMNVIFVDESYLRLFHNDSRKRVRRHKGEALQPDYLVPRFRHEGGGVMFWGCVSWYGVGPLVPIEGSVRGDTYKNLLSNYIPQVAQQLMTTSPYIIEDGPNVHKTKDVLDEKKRLNLRSLGLPPNSPDLNVIEGVWSIWKDKVARRQPLSLAELTEVGLEEWRNITVEEIRTLIRSMPSRIEAIYTMKGGHTKY